MQPAEADTDRSGCGRENGPDRAGRKPAESDRSHGTVPVSEQRMVQRAGKYQVTIRKYIRDKIDDRKVSAFRRKRISSFLM